MRGHSMFENRETSAVPVGKNVQAGRPGKVCGRNPGMYAAEESDTGKVPKKAPNKIGRPMRRCRREGRGPREILKRRLRTVRGDRGKH